MEPWRRHSLWDNAGPPVRICPGGLKYLSKPATIVAGDIHFFDDGTAEVHLGWQGQNDRRHFSSMPLHHLEAANALMIS